MIACFFAGRITAQDDIFWPAVVTVEQPEVSLQEIRGFAGNEDLKNQFTELYGQLMVFLATPQVQIELVNPNSAIYQRLAELIVLIRSNLNQEII